MRVRKKRGADWTPPPLTTPAVEKLLLDRYAAPKFFTFFDVGNGTGGRCFRRADALSVGMWPSTGLELEGFELKVSRGDFTRELRNPMKARAISKFCDRWWIVAPKGICKPAELPEDWGLLEACPVKKSPGSWRLRIAKKAPLLKAEPMTRTFLASMIRRANESSRRDTYAPKVR